MSNRLNFSFVWRFTPIANAKSNTTATLLRSDIFATNYADVTYLWRLSIKENCDGNETQIVPYLRYRCGPLAAIECIETYHIVGENNQIIAQKMESNQFEVGKGYGPLDGPFKQTIDRQYRANIASAGQIAISVDLSIAKVHFDPINVLPSIHAQIVSPNTEKMLQRVLTGDRKSIERYCVKTICADGGEFFVDPNFFVDASDYFHTMFTFNEATKAELKEIDFTYISKERMIILITYIYTRRIAALPDDIDSIKELLNEASMMLFDEVKNACERRLGERLIESKGGNMSLAADLLIFANLNSLQGLKSIALSMIARNIEKLSNCKETNAKRLYELLKKNDDSSSSSSLFDELLEHSAQCRRCPIGELKVQSRKRKLLD